MQRLLDIVAGALVFFAATCGAAAEPLYRLVDLGPLPQAAVGTEAFAINDAGVVVGTSLVNNNGNIANARPVKWVDGVPSLLWNGPESACADCTPPIVPITGFDGGMPLAINSAGVVVGRARSSSYTGTPLPTYPIPEGSRPFVFDGSTFVVLNLFGGSRGEIRDVNDFGLVAGGALDAAGYPHAFTWHEADGVRDLGVLPGGSWAHATALNNHGQVVGNSTVEGGQERGFVFDPDRGMQRLEGFGESSRALDINDAGWVAGFSWLPNGPPRAVVWPPALPVVDLGVLPGFTASEANAINDSNTVVGQLRTISSVSQAFVWTPDAGMRLLAEFADVPSDLTLHEAVAINNQGEIVARATREGQRRGILLVPIPEPIGSVLVVVVVLLVISTKLSQRVFSRSIALSRSGHRSTRGGNNPSEKGGFYVAPPPIGFWQARPDQGSRSS